MQTGLRRPLEQGTKIFVLIDCYEIYVIFLLLGTTAYWACGMSLFDSVCHAMCSLSTGGFSTKLNSIGEYHSLSIEIVTIVLMLIGTTSFAVLLLLVRGKWRQALGGQRGAISVPDTGGFRSIGPVPVRQSGLCRGLPPCPDAASALSTTGYATMSYESWPPFALGLMILLMLIGGGIGSTVGGLKLTRVYLILRMIGQNVRKKLLPQR